MDCSKCISYNRGSGSKACLKCPKYKDIQRRSGKRKTIKIEVLPDAIIEQLADMRGPDDEIIIDRIRQLPPDLAAILSLRYMAGMRINEIAGALHISVRTAQRRLDHSLACIKINLSSQ